MEGYLINSHQTKHLLELVACDYLVYLPQKKDGKIVFDLLENMSDIRFFSETIIPFKKIIFPNHRAKNFVFKKPIALVGLHHCDVAALEIFYHQFSNSNLLPPRKDLLIIGSECKPNDDCFCDIFSADKLGEVDFYLQKESDRISIFALTAKSKKYLAKLGIKESAGKYSYRPIQIEKSGIDKESIKENVESRSLHQDFWQGVANNCFGCDACTAVCPLCFCFRQDYKNAINGTESQCLNWDSCFAKEFSEVQNHFDLRPENVDRLYNWYHHKFVRAEKELSKPLCVGCGRCIKACPAHLNIKNILHSLEESSN